MDRCKRNYNKKFNLEKLSDDQLIEFINSVESEDEIYSSDDSVFDPDYVVDNIEPDSLDELPKNDEQATEECIQEMNEAETTDAFLQAVNLSINISEIENPAASSTFVLGIAADETEQEPSTSTAIITNSRLKSPKRARSPLPTFEATGPSVQPTAGGYTGGGIPFMLLYKINIHCVYFFSKL